MYKPAFDSYTLGARLRPFFLSVFPVFLTIYLWLPISRTVLGGILGLAAFFGIFTFVANQISTKGNEIQKELFEKWGGPPTTKLLRWSDSTIDRYTKQRYRNKLDSLISEFKNISQSSESKNPKLADELYSSAASYLREATRDTNKFHLVFKENISYGFSRNLFAIKWFSISICVGSLLINIGLMCHHIFGNAHNAMLHVYYWPIVVGLIAWLICLIFVVKESWVYSRAYAYSKALLASCDHLSGSKN